MAKQRKPEGETAKEAELRRSRELVANTATRGEKVSWDRLMNNMVSLLATLRPIEDALTDLLAQKAPIIDDIQKLRKTMVKNCVHPLTHLVNVDTDNGSIVVCKFCNKKFPAKYVTNKEKNDSSKI